MKEKQNKRWGLMLLSVLSAFLVWLGVVNVADPVMTDTVEVPVEIRNEEILTGNGLTYEIVGKKTATISYEVNTTNAHRIRSSDFRAYADMTEMWSVTGSIPIQIEVLNHGEYLVSDPVSRTSTIKIETEPLQRKQFSIGYTTVGSFEDGYEAGDVVLDPGSLYLEGPESLVGQISGVGIEIPVDGVSADVSDVAQVLYYDANGNRIQLSDRITSDFSDISYQLTVLKVKNLSLDFQVSGEVASGYRFTGVECDVRNVSVVGLKSVLASLQTITIPGDRLDMTGASTNVVKTINLEEYLPEGVALAGTGRSEINVILTVEKLEERVFTVEVNDACYVGESDDYIYRPDPDTLNIRVRALKEELDSLELDSSDVEIDVSDMAEGENEARVTVNLDQAYEVMSISNCTITVRKVPEETDEAEMTMGPGAGSGEPETGAAEASAEEEEI